MVPIVLSVLEQSRCSTLTRGQADRFDRELRQLDRTAADEGREKRCQLIRTALGVVLALDH